MTWSSKAKRKAKDRNRLRKTIALSKLDEIDLFDSQWIAGLRTL